MNDPIYRNRPKFGQNPLGIVKMFVVEHFHEMQIMKNLPQALNLHIDIATMAMYGNHTMPHHPMIEQVIPYGNFNQVIYRDNKPQD